MEQTKPVLVYDGDCGFCKYWAFYWQKLTGDRVDYAPYQDVAGRYPDIPPDDFRRAVQYIAPDGKVAKAAEASLLTLSHAPGKAFWLTLYRRVPGFKPVSEFAYTCIAARRPFFYGISKFLWGRELEPPRYDLVSWWFMRVMGLLYLMAFASFAVQADGLICSGGILPLSDFTAAVKSHLGTKAYGQLPMVFWLDASDRAIQLVCWGGVALSLMLMFNVLTRLALLALYILYLSLMYGGQSFMTYQWDIFLVETGFLALVMSVARTPGIWLLRWLLFRFMFMSGAVKLLSGDASWADFSALTYHFLTQPLPTPLAWHAAQIPAEALKFAVGMVFLIELVLPFLIFFPRKMRFLAAYGIIALESVIFATGNYNFFNLHNIALCLILFDDQSLRAGLPRLSAFAARFARKYSPPYRPVSYAAWALAGLLVVCSLTQMTARFGKTPPDWAMKVNESMEPWRIVNSYGLFSVMTTKRGEIVIEGSDDGVNWKEYTFIYKPGDVTRGARWNVPHQPRLDWQMWFAALDDPRRLPWFSRFLERILQNAPAVLALMEHNPFPDTPPTYVRALYYDYTYASREEVKQGIYWNRKLLGTYFPQAQLTRH